MQCVWSTITSQASRDYAVSLSPEVLSHLGAKVSSRRRKRRTSSLFSWKIHHYSCLPIYFGGFLHANANHRQLISKRSLKCETCCDFFIHLSSFRSRFRRSLIYSKLFILGLRSIIIVYRWISDEYCNIFLPSG